jgi:hypothetical protein
VSAEHAPPGDDRWQRFALLAIVVGAMAVSIGGQVSAVEARMGGVLAWVFALVNDAAAIMALNAVLAAPKGDSIRKWGWATILLAAGTGGSLNTWHITNPGTLTAETGKMVAPALPPEFGFLVGWEPVLLILVLSHLIGLVVASRKARATTSPGDHQPATTRDHQTTSAGGRQATQVVVGGRQAGDRQTTSSHHQITSPDRQAVTARITSPPAPARQAVAASTTRPPAVSVPVDRQTASPGDRQATAQTTSRQPATRPVEHPTRALAAIPAPRPAWMTDGLLQSVVTAMAKAEAEGKQYGRGRVMEDHGLNDYRAGTILKLINEHNLLGRSA